MPPAARATSTRHVLLEHRHFGEFKVPGLRDLARTAPYMHDGSLAHAARGGAPLFGAGRETACMPTAERILVPLRLTPAETEDLLAFLHSLNAP